MREFAMSTDGAAVAAQQTFGAIDPSTGEVFADAPECARQQLDEAMAAAAVAVPREVAQDDERGYATVERRPLGVVAAIMPWNFPLLLAGWKLGPALRAGNTVVLKPSPSTPLSSLALGEVLSQTLPPGEVSVNDHLTLEHHLPFGGVKWSGASVENGPWGLEEFSSLRTLYRSRR